MRWCASTPADLRARRGRTFINSAETLRAPL